MTDYTDYQAVKRLAETTDFTDLRRDTSWFMRWLEGNWELVGILNDMSLDLLNAGHRESYSIDLLFGKLRYDEVFREARVENLRGDGEPHDQQAVFKLNSNAQSFIARMLMAGTPALHNFFQVRASIGTYMDGLPEENVQAA